MTHTIETLEEMRRRWHETHTYSVVRSHREPKNQSRTIVATALHWDDAQKMADKLQEEECRKKPLESSWTRDVFLVEMEPTK